MVLYIIKTNCIWSFCNWSGSVVYQEVE